ncbi:MAG: diacylglycerol kinase family lipid kinase [Clostridia bacterium]|nr:diacylglycerol kinase family lipid kinase [Clostridia bacterium]
MYNFVVNKGSGKKRGAEYLQRITEYCDKKGIEYTVYQTNAKGHATTLTRELCEDGADNVIAIGGDGTFHEVVNGIVTNGKTVVGFIPAGRGNDFARTSKLSNDPIEAFEDILRGETKNIDFIQCGDKRCLNVAGAGMDVEVLQAVINKKNAITYYMSLIKCLLKLKPYSMRIKINGEWLEKSCIMVGVGNGKAFGGGMYACPDAKIDDGKLDLLIIEKHKRGVMRLIPGFVKGKHEKLPEITHYEVEEVEIDNGGYPVELDGEIYENLPFHCKVVKGGLITYKVKADME